MASQLFNRKNINVTIFKKLMPLIFRKFQMTKKMHIFQNRSKSVLNTLNSCAYMNCYKNSKCIATSALSFVKSFIQTENMFAHKIMEDNPLYSNTLVSNIYDCKSMETSDERFHHIISSNWTTETTENICNGFKEITSHILKSNLLISDPIFESISNSISEKCTEFTDDQVTSLLAHLSLWPQTDTINSPNFVDIWSALDKECEARVKLWDINTLLYVADHWYKLSLAKVSQYMLTCSKKLTRKPNKLSPTQFVQCMFFINICRKFNLSSSMYELEFGLENCVHKLSLDELAIVAMAFFKTETRIQSSKILGEMIRRVTQEVNQINDISLAALVKVFRYSVPPTLTDMLYELLDKLVPHINRLSLMSCVHIALAGTNTQLFHEELHCAISNRFVTEIKLTRIKDLERVVFALTLFDYDPKTTPCIYEAVLKELQNPERDEEILKYSKCLPRCLYYLSLRKIYPYHLISKVLDSQYITENYGKNSHKVGREILCLDANLPIDCPDYDGNRIDSKLRKRLAKGYMFWIPERSKKHLNATEKMLMEVYDTTVELLFGADYVFAGHILPQFPRADITLYLKPDGTPHTIPKDYRELEYGDIKYAPNVEVDGKWLCVVIGGWNSYIRGSDVLLGSTATKLRQLRLVGYTPILIPWFEWNKLTKAQMLEYLKRKICNDAIK